MKTRALELTGSHVESPKIRLAKVAVREVDVRDVHCTQVNAAKIAAAEVALLAGLPAPIEFLAAPLAKQ